MAYEAAFAAEHTFSRPRPFVRRDCRPDLSELTLICCCSGYGKTAYLSQLAEDHPASVCISPGCSDDSPARIIALLSVAIPEADVDTCDIIPEAVSRAAAALCDRAPGLLLIDNADAVVSDDGCYVMRLLADAALRGGIRVVYAARTIPRYLLPLVNDNLVTMWGAQEMRFTPQEISSLAGELFPGMTGAALSSLTVFTGGWCAAVPALLRTGREDMSAAADESVLSEYIEGMIADTLPPDLRKMYLRSAFLQGDEEFYRDGLQMPDMRAALCRLSRMGMVLRDGDSFTCPEVMRYLLSHLLTQDEKNSLMEQASDYYVRSKRFAEAIRLFEVSGDGAAAERILRLYGDRLLQNCEFELIGYCGRIIGDVERVKDPSALGALAQYYYYDGDYDRMEQAFNRADSMFGKENKYSVLRMLYKGLLRYERKPALYGANVLSALDWLKKHDEPMPFLYRRELDVLESITGQGETRPEGGKLYVHRFGGLHLTAGENRAEIQCKTKRSTELIAYMLEHGDRPVGRDVLLDAFWHDNMPANAVAMLHNMIYHLRRELSAYGLENIISYKNKYYTLDNSLIALEDKEILDTCAAAESGDRSRLTAHDGLLRTYWGSYLGTLDSLWANEKREYYDRCYINACSSLAGQYRAEGRYEDAAALYRNAYRLDPYSEQLVGELLNCYAALGQPDQARRCYEEYAAKLDEEFGTRPGKWLRNCFFSCFAEEA